MQKKAQGQRLILNDGVEIENAGAGYADGFLWCYLPGYSVIQAFPLFSDSEKTKKIIFEYGGMTDVYDGFTIINAIIQGENETKISLRKDSANV